MCNGACLSTCCSGRRGAPKLKRNVRPVRTGSGLVRCHRAFETGPKGADTLSAKDFRRISLEMKGAVESAHMGHPDFRVNGRIFATLHPDHQSGMVKLTPDRQRIFVRENPSAFIPENGAWGAAGMRERPVGFRR